LNAGITVSGSDQQLSPMARRLHEKGAQVFLGHSPKNIAGADIVVRSSAIPDENTEVLAAREAGLPVLKRVDFLDQLIDDQMGIAIAGTHGKTTTTAMIAWMLSSLDYDPSYVIGSDSKNLNNNAHAGKGDYFVIEADEYDRMFHGLSPYLAIITNVEHDHPDCYPTSEEFFDAFYKFIDCIQEGGILLVCADDPGVQKLLEKVSRSDLRIITYGLKSCSDFYAVDLEPNQQGGFSFDFVSRDGQESVPVSLKVPGKHNVNNALAALGVAKLLDISLADAAGALHDFLGTGRRFEVVGEVSGITLVDDYAHHPTEIRATLLAARARYANRRIWVVWQPHTYSRTRSLYEEFLGAFSDADALLITEIFAARENPPEDGFSAQIIARALGAFSKVKPDSIDYRPDLESARDFMFTRLEPDDVLIVLSAGDAHRINKELLEMLQTQKPLVVDNDAMHHNVIKE
jgi:UDP-N-acetylmuramate--alanine ligase